MNVLNAAAVLLVLAGTSGHAQQSSNLVGEVRAAIARQDFAEGDRLIASRRAAAGVTPEMLEALSWMGRGALAAGQLDIADAYGRQTYDLALVALKGRGVDEDPRMATAVGASIEVLAQAGARLGTRSEAVAFLQQELQRWGDTSLRKRIQKNINLLSLEGVSAPPIDATEYLGPTPPTLDSLRGKVVLLFFWAHWCGDCKTQAQVLARLLERYGGQGLTLLAPTQRYGYVAGGTPATADVEKRYIDQVRRSAYSQLIDMPAPLGAATHDRYGVSTTPTLVLVDRKGVVRLYHPGRMTEDELEPVVRRLVTGGQP